MHWSGTGVLMYASHAFARYQRGVIRPFTCKDTVNMLSRRGLALPNRFPRVSVRPTPQYFLTKYITKMAAQISKKRKVRLSILSMFVRSPARIRGRHLSALQPSTAAPVQLVGSSPYPGFVVYRIFLSIRAGVCTRGRWSRRELGIWSTAASLAAADVRGRGPIVSARPLA